MTSIEEVKSLLNNLDFNNLSLEAVGCIRNMVRDLVIPTGDRKRLKDELADETERAIMIANSAYSKKEPKNLINKIKESEVLARHLSVFVGDCAIDEWNYFKPAYMSESDALALMLPFARYVFPDAHLRNFIKMFFEERKRELWMPAAEALAILANRDDETRDYLAEKWKARFPKGITEHYFSAAIPRDGGKQHDIDNTLIHEMRHLFYATAHYIKNTGDNSIAPGFDLQRIKEYGFPKDDADCSIVIDVLSVLWAVEAYRADIIEILQCHLKKQTKSYLIEDSIRLFYDHAGSEDQSKILFALLNSYLLDLEFSNDLLAATSKNVATANLIDLIISWKLSVETILTEKESEKIDDYRTKIETAYPEYACALDIIFSGYEKPDQKKRGLDVLIHSLTAVLDEHAWFTNNVKDNAFNVAKIIFLSEKPELADLPLRHLLGLTKIEIEKNPAAGKLNAALSADETLGESICPFLLLLLATRKVTPKIFFYGKKYDEATIKALAGIDNDYISIQAAIQIESLLRTITDVNEKVRWLWQLLLDNPGLKVLNELYKLIRGSNTALHVIVKNLYALEKLRVAPTCDSSNYLPTYLTLLKSVKVMLGSNGSESVCKKPIPASKESDKLLENLINYINTHSTDLDTEKEPLKNLDNAFTFLKDVFSSGYDSSFKAWLEWLDLDKQKAEEAWVEFSEQAEAVRQEEPFVSEMQITRLRRVLQLFNNSLSNISWPELTIINAPVAVIKEWIEGLSETRENADALNREYLDIVKNKKDINALKSRLDDLLKDDAVVKLLLPETIKTIHRFLQYNLEIRQSERFRKNKSIAAKTNLNSFAFFLSPLLIGIMVGPLFVLDFGELWLELIEPGKEINYFLTIFIAIGISTFIFYFNFYQMEFMSLRSFKMICKSALIFFLSFILAFISAAVVLLTVSDTTLTAEVRSFHDLFRMNLIWSSLSLLFGWLIGIILQGRRLISD
jgi:hypothetical protein